MTHRVGSYYVFFLLHTDIEGSKTLQNTSETVKYLNNLYKIILKTLTWPEALRECQKHGMRLVSISDPYQQAFLTVQAVQHNSSLWIGLSSEDVSFQTPLPGSGNGLQHFLLCTVSYQTKKHPEIIKPYCSEFHEVYSF